MSRPIFLYSLLLLLSAHLLSSSSFETYEPSNKRGVLIAMGPVKSHFAGALSTIRSLRNTFKCDLPIEIWSYGSEFKLFPPSAKRLLESIPNVSHHALEEADSFSGLNWELERDWYRDYVGFSSMARALWSTQLDEVMAIDIDTVLFVSPEKIFNTKQYLETGTLFLFDKFLPWWPHYYPPYDAQWIHQFIKSYDGTFDHLPVWNLSSIPYYERDEFRHFSRSGSQHLAESSLVLFDMRRHKRTIAILKDITTRLGQELYKNIYGDKESYWIACELARVPYAFSGWASSHWGMVSGPIVRDKPLR